MPCHSDCENGQCHKGNDKYECVQCVNGKFLYTNTNISNNN